MSGEQAEKHEKAIEGRQERKRNVGRPPKPRQEIGPLTDTLAKTLFHFFPEWRSWLDQFPEPRQEEKVTYPRRVLVMGVIMIFLLRLGSRRQWTHDTKSDLFTENINRIVATQLDRMPHGDTLENYLERVLPEYSEELNRKMVQRLIRMKVLDSFRLEGYFLLAFDGTQQFIFHERHCDHCLTKKKDGKVLYYYHNVLEAKIVCHNGMAISVATEFIENESQGVSKQDCELRAFYRLAPKVKKAFQRLPLCLLLDSLFAGRPVFDLCEKYSWKYFIVFKEGSMPAQWEEYQALKGLSPENHIRHQPEAHIVQKFRWVNDLPYEGHSLKLIECKERDEKEDKNHLFVWFTNFDVGRGSVITLANKGGRLRWKIENEGFNTQKNGGYELEHPYSKHPIAMKNFYFLLQVAYLLHQLMEKGSLLKEFKAAFGSVKGFIKRLLEAFRNVVVSIDAVNISLACSFQIRLDTS